MGSTPSKEYTINVSLFKNSRSLIKSNFKNKKIILFYSKVLGVI